MSLQQELVSPEQTTMNPDKFREQFYGEAYTYGQEVSLQPHAPAELDLANGTELGSAINNSQAVSQDLMGVLEVGGPEGEKFAIVRVTDTNTGETRATLNSLARNENERAKVVSVIEPGKDIVVGRQSDLPGMSEMSDLVSRNHLKLSVDKDGKLDITDLASTNGTKLVTAPENSQYKIQNMNAWSVKSDEMRGMLDEAKANHQVSEKVSAADELNQQLKDLEAQFSEEDARNLWRYASATLNKQEAQAEGDGSGSTIYGQQAGQAYRELSPEAVASSRMYLELMKSIEKERSRQQ